MATLEAGYAERTIATVRFQESNSSITGVAIPLLLAVAGAPPQVMIEPVVGHEDISSATNTSGMVSYWISERDLYKALNAVVEQLLNEQVELDADAKAALYEDRWQLYD